MYLLESARGFLVRFAQAVGRAKWLPLVLLLWGVFALAFLWGRYATLTHKFPDSWMFETETSFKDLGKSILTALGKPEYPYFRTSQTKTVVMHDRAALASGNRLITGLGANGALFAKLVDVDGRVLNYWDLDWFKLWPHPTHLPAGAIPKERPGTLIFGAVLDPDGDLVFNYYDLGTMKVDFCDRPVWRLPMRTHHSITKDSQGNYWIPEFTTRTTPYPGLTDHVLPMKDYHVIQVSPSGKVLQKFDIFDLLLHSNYRAMLYVESANTNSNMIYGDILHLNHVEVFPDSMPEGAFKHGDVMVSFRNINTIFIFDPHTKQIKYLINGPFVRQHDPHFVDGWTISVFDNNNINDSSNPRVLSSRIATYSVKTGEVKVIFQGTPQHPFFSRVMGKHEWLDNGDLLIAEAEGGRALEISPDGRVLWEYYNQTGRKGEVGILTQISRISPDYLPQSKIEELKAQCH